ncbi:MAG: Tex family protein [Thiotrichales bacterium]
MIIAQVIAAELGAAPAQVISAVKLLDEGATVPFIARYRKEVTGGLDDTQLRNLEERLGYLRELDERRATILKSIGEQGKLTPALQQQLATVMTKTELEDLYLPYKPKRRTKAQIAREAGLEPLALALLANPALAPQVEAVSFVDVDKGVADVTAALDGARQILMEQFAEDAALLAELREFLWERGQLKSTVVEGKQAEGQKFADYFEYAEPIAKIPSHRALALFRGRNEDVLNVTLEVEHGDAPHPCEGRVARHFNVADQGRAGDGWLLESVRWAWKVKIASKLELDLKLRLREQAEAEAIEVFGRNLKDLLLAAPAGPRVCMGLDPGLRTGVKVAVVDATGKLLVTDTIYPHVPRNQWDASIDRLAKISAACGVQLISIGNGTASRETDKLAGDLIQRHPELKLQKIVVSEAGASVYSASELAAKEFPELDVSLRGAVSIARRLQDPLAELVKIDPKAIGVGQYQHDVSQPALARKLGAVVEDCVNAVGVDVNTASAPLLARVSGLSASLAANVVAFRDQNGAFRTRTALKKVARLGDKAFEQAAGFLRIMNGDNPLDASAVHPEAYPVIERIIGVTGKDVRSLIGDAKLLASLDPARFTDEHFGVPTVKDILRELDKPGRDPRPEFKTATFRDGVETLADLAPGMTLEGVVTNVTNFGAFVDIGVHQDGLVHISMLADRFVKDPREVVAAGQIVKVKVLEVDAPRKRIALTMKLGEASAPVAPKMAARQSAAPPRGRQVPAKAAEKPATNAFGAMAQAFAKAKK